MPKHLLYLSDEVWKKVLVMGNLIVLTMEFNFSNENLTYGVK